MKDPSFLPKICKTIIRPKKILALFLEISRVKIFYHSPARIVKFILEYTYFNFKIKHKKITRIEKTKEAKQEKRRSAKNLMGYDDIVYEFALCNSNLVDRIVNFYWLFV